MSPTTANSRPSADEALRVLAEALAPHMAAALQRLGYSTTPTPVPTADYSAETCALFVSALGDEVVDRAFALFEPLAKHGQMTSIDLAEDLGAVPRELSSLVTNSIKRRAARLNLPLPFVVDETPDGARTVWRDRDGIAQRMVDALSAEEQHRRSRRPVSTGRKYDALGRELDRHAGEDEVTLTFGEIEEIIGEPLPPSARGRRQWWSNQQAPGGHIQAESWMRAGFRAFPSLAAERVTFRRAQTDSST